MEIVGLDHVDFNSLPRLYEVRRTSLFLAVHHFRGVACAVYSTLWFGFLRDKRAAAPAPYSVQVKSQSSPLIYVHTFLFHGRERLPWGRFLPADGMEVVYACAVAIPLPCSSSLFFPSFASTSACRIRV